MAGLFGTDGVRGIANRDVTPELALALGRALVTTLSGRRPTVVVGRDTRASGEMLESALSAGICSAGGDVRRLGVIPTPAVAFLTTDLDADAGAVISASHNPPEDNGIKFFSADGMKLPDAMEEEIERLVGESGGPRPEGPQVGRIIPEQEDGAERYIAHLVASCEGTLGGMRIVVDGAHGAAYRLAPELLRRLGADVVAIGDEPDGANINVGCGATHLETLSEAVRRFRADAGVAHDGDADRALFCDEEGAVVDGDHVLAACGVWMRDRGTLAKDTVVTTVMANLGFRKAMEREGITVLETKVGDRYVLETMLRSGAVLGGEQSGHVIFRDAATTGDGLLTAARFLTLVRSGGGSVREVASIVRKYPQRLEAVQVADLDALEEADDVWAAVRSAESDLGSGGRVLVRPSGTEPVVRVMVEAESEDEARRHTAAISEVVRRKMGS